MPILVKVQPDRNLRGILHWVVLGLLGVIFCPVAHTSSKDNPQKDKPEKTKKEKVVSWVEVRTSHFIVVSDGGESTSRRVADQFEQVLGVFQAGMPNARLGTGIPIRILAVKDSQGFAKLLPEFPVDKRRSQPAGLFVRGSEKNYIALRMNASGVVPFEDIYQNYARLILKLSYRSLPPWLEEGYISAFGSMAITGKGAKLGRPDPEDLSVLFESPLLPLDIVLHVDRNSPYYDSGDKRTVYFAESRALVHYLLTDPQMSQEKPLSRYISLVEGGADSLEAARQSFGELSQLQDKLESYIKQTVQTPSDVASGNVAESAISPKTLSPAEAESRIAEFEFYRGHLDDAQAKLEDAIALDPSLAGAEENLGYVLLKQGQLEDAEKHFDRALALDPKSALTYYGQGMISMAKGGDVGVPLGAIAGFEKAVALNPDFAPAWSNLAAIYARQPETMQKALVAAQHATSLAPGDPGYQYTLAEILGKMGQNGEAQKVATRLQNSSNDLRIADKAGDLQARNSGVQSSSPPVLRNDPPQTSSPDRAVHIERKTDPVDDKRVTAPSAKTPEEEPPPAPTPQQPSVARTYSMVGTIAEANCSDAPQILITLKALTIVMHLHAVDVAHLSIKPARAPSPTKTSPCGALRGRNARISYQLSSGTSWDGEIESIELRNAP